MSEHKCCREMLALISDYVDGSIDEASCEQLEKHLEDCENCQTMLDTMRKTIFLYQDTNKDAAVPDPVRERLFHCLNLEEFLK